MPTHEQLAVASLRSVWGGIKHLKDGDKSRSITAPATTPQNHLRLWNLLQNDRVARPIVFQTHILKVRVSH